MELKTGKASLVLMLIAACGTRFTECSTGGREVKTNEFPYTVFVNGMKSGSNADNSTGQMCLGVLYGSITVVTAPRCFMDSYPEGSQSGSVRTSQNMFTAGESEKWYPVFGFRYSDPQVMQGNLLTLAILNLLMPGIMVDPYMGDEAMNATNDGNSTGVKVAEWYEHPQGIMELTENDAMGVVPTPDKKVVAMKLIGMKECRDRYYQLAPPPPYEGNTSDIPSTAICAITAPGPVTPLKHDSVPPGDLCDSDAGSPFVYEDYVVGILVKAFCGAGNTSLAVFLTSLPPSDIEMAEAVAPTPSSNRSADGRPTPPPLGPGRIPPISPDHPPESEGHSLHVNRHWVAVTSAAVLLITKQKA